MKHEGKLFQIKKGINKTKISLFIKATEEMNDWLRGINSEMAHCFIYQLFTTLKRKNRSRALSIAPRLNISSTTTQSITGNNNGNNYLKVNIFFSKSSSRNCKYLSDTTTFGVGRRRN